MVRATLRFLSRDWVIGLICFVGALLSYGRHLEFSHRYHADETGKIRQLVSGQWNFHHPLLLLGTARVALAAGGMPDDARAVALVGRRVAVAFAAAAAALLVAALCRLRGPALGWFALPLLWLHPKVAFYAHFLKEDPALLFGIAGCIYAAARYFGGGGRGWMWACGAFAGLSAAAKYVGALALAAMAPLVGAWPVVGARGGWREATGGARAIAARAALVCALAPGVFLLVNAPLAWRAGTFRRSLGVEWEKATETVGEENRRVDERRAGYLRLLFEPRTERLTLLCAAYAALLLLPPWRRRNGAEPFALAWLALYLGGIFWATKTADRYLLPHFFLTTFFGSLGLADAARALSRLPGRAWLGRGAALALWIAAAAHLYPVHLQAYRREMRRLTDYGGRLELIEVLRERLPPDAVIAYMSRVALIDPLYPGEYPPGVRPLPQRVIELPVGLSERRASELRDAGVTHLVVTEKELGRAWPRGPARLQGLQPLLDGAEQIRALHGESEQSAFYEDLLVFRLRRSGG